MSYVAINTIITFIISTVLGWCLNAIKNYKQTIAKKRSNEKLQNIALQTLLKNNLTNTYFVYSKMKKIPDYVYKNFLDMLEVYESLDGNGFIHTLAKKMETWDIIKTDILDK